MRRRSHLFLTLSRKGWGETSLGLQVARQVRSAGDEVSFLAHSGSMAALSGAGFDVEEVPDHLGPLVELVIGEKIRNDAITSLVLCDFVTTNYMLDRCGVEPKRLLSFGLPIVALDTWEYHLTGASIDAFGGRDWNVATWIDDIGLRLVPVPIGRPASRGAYCGRPAVARPASAMRQARRAELGLSQEEVAVLFCTADWQHGIKNPDGQRMADATPPLLWDYLAQVHQSVKMIHIGPVPLPFDDPDRRYCWLPPMSPADFDLLLASVDLLLSANISATTIGRAMVLEVPVLVVQNSCTAQGAAEAKATRRCLSPSVRTWLAKADPIYRFSLWPLGYWQFLQPLLKGNPYRDALSVVELIDETDFVSTCRSLLFDSHERAASIERQTTYGEQVRRLPTAAHLIESYLR
jgi:hypothetical protein